jgi:hypothetical protein
MGGKLRHLGHQRHNASVTERTTQEEMAYGARQEASIHREVAK